MFVFDEFQQIGELKENHAVEAAIRHAVERSQYVSYIACGVVRLCQPLTALAYQPTQMPQGQAFCEAAGLSSSGVQKGLNDLQKLDMIFLDPAGYYRVLDPAIAYFIRKNAFSSSNH